MFDSLKASAQRYAELEAELEDPELHADPQRMASVAREMGALRSKAEGYATWADLEQRRESTEELLAEKGLDAEMRELAEVELAEIAADLEIISEKMKREVVDDDPDKGRTVILEIRAGTGGDEASLFCSDLVKVYSRFSESRGWKTAILSASASDVGGYKECTLEIAGADAWELLRYESGGHRVQRVPATESQGRIHTSAATVAAMPEAEDVEFEIDEGDLRIDTYRSSGPGGQSVNKTSSAIRITHEPTGTVVQCQDEKSQHKNKAKAMKMLRTRLFDAERQARKADEDATRRSLIGSGDRSARIRTYNWPQNRVTDHRIKTNYGLEQILLGQLDKLISDLTEHDLEQKLAALSTGAS